MNEDLAYNKNYKYNNLYFNSELKYILTNYNDYFIQLTESGLYERFIKEMGKKSDTLLKNFRINLILFVLQELLSEKKLLEYEYTIRSKKNFYDIIKKPLSNYENITTYDLRPIQVYIFMIKILPIVKNLRNLN